MKRLLGIFLVLPALAHASESVIPALQKMCPGLERHAKDLTWSSPVKENASLNAEREHGWRQVYAVVATVADKPSRRVAAELKAAGNRCHFEVEASNLRGAAFAKKACFSLCNDKPLTEAPTTASGIYLATFR